MRYPSLQRRLALRIGALFLVTMIAGIGFAIFRIQAVGPAFDRLSLKTQLDTLAADLPAGAPPAYSGGETAPIFAVWDESGRAIARSPGADAAGIAARLPAKGEGFFQYRPPATGPDRPVMRDGLAAHRTVGGQPLIVAVIEGLNPDDELLGLMADEATDDLLFVGIPFTLIAGLIGVATLRGSLAVVSEVSNTARAIGPSAPGLRLDRPGIPRELLPLVQAVDGMVDRLEAAIESQRRFTAEAAHQLRTPLAIAVARLDQAGADAGPLAAGLRGDLDRLERLVRQMLAAARAEAGLYAGPAESLQVRALAEDAVEALLPLAFSLGVELGIEGRDDFALTGNRAALHGMIANLIENALEHSPRGAAVDIAIDDHAISVADSGPGVPAELRTRIFERFWSGTKPGGRQGSGLGLVIASAIARQHGADLSVGDRPGGGAVFTVDWNPSAKDRP
ncbi:sensor histidine kinase [Zavarzinia aquatilis]|uniref:histidine kinase n=1 Tax=Zavarzinia aquatilis TaxID=2211142 RepID=A0A317E1X5_9PROT|nr:ATP-binding protein [Zavarzinia aquatilis]PWR20414.1 hypothetical protein DKG74_15535 [Zavarzinia aquatilis]